MCSNFRATDIHELRGRSVEVVADCLVARGTQGCVIDGHRIGTSWAASIEWRTGASAGVVDHFTKKEFDKHIRLT